MRLYEISSNPQFFFDIEKEAVKHGSPISNDNGRIIYPEFERVDMSSYFIRFAVTGKTIEIMQNPSMETWLNQHGWHMTVCRPFREMYGKNPDGTQRYKEFLEIRLEYIEGQEPYEVPEILYHVTPSKNVPSIMKNGLIPSHASRPEMHRYSEPRIFFSTNMEGAEKIKRIFIKYDESHSASQQYSILKVKSSGVKLYKDQEFRLNGLYTKDRIPPENIIS